MTHRAEVRRVVEEALHRFGHIDVWINNVGRGISRLPSELTDEDIDSMMLVNVKSALYGMQEILPHFKSRDRGHIINVSSMLGRMPTFLPRAAYSASKHFLNALTANFRTEIHGSHPGIQVSLVSPGVVRDRLRSERHARRRGLADHSGRTDGRGSGRRDCRRDRVAEGRRLHAAGRDTTPSPGTTQPTRSACRIRA